MPKILDGNQPANARQRLIEAGISLFAEKGYSSTSVREIVEQAGVTKPVLYYYFKNKEGLFHAILDWASEQHEAILAQVMGGSVTVLQGLSALYTYIHEGVMKYPDLFRMIHNLAFGPPSGAPPCDIDRFHRRMIEAIKGLYRVGLLRQEVKEADMDDVAMVIFAVMDYCFHTNYIKPQSLGPERTTRLLRLVFEGLLSRRRTARR